MPVSQLSAVATGTLDQWALGSGASKPAAINIDDASTYIYENVTANDSQLFTWTSLPASSHGGVISDFEVEATSRRGGGSTAGTWRREVYDGSNTSYGANVTPGSTFPPPRTFESFATDPSGNVWTQAVVDAIEVGSECVTVGTGINVFFIRLNVTWIQVGGPQNIIGCAWLLPLIGAGLKGLNLFHEATEWYKHFDYLIYRKAMQAGGITTFPAISLRKERELVLRELFTERAYAI